MKIRFSKIFWSILPFTLGLSSLSIAHDIREVYSDLPSIECSSSQGTAVPRVVIYPSASGSTLKINLIYKLDPRESYIVSSSHEEFLAILKGEHKNIVLAGHETYENGVYQQALLLSLKVNSKEEEQKGESYTSIIAEMGVLRPISCGLYIN